MIKKKPKSHLDPTRSPPIPFDKYQWYVLFTNRNRESDVAIELEAMGCFTLVPLETKTRIPKRQSKIRGAGKKLKLEVYQVPWLSQTIFVGYPDYPNWFHVKQITYVKAILETAYQPARLRPQEIIQLKDRSEALRHKTTPQSNPVVSGGMAKVMAGLFAGKTIEVGQLKGKYAQIRAMLDNHGELIEQRLPVTVRIEDLEAT